MGRGRGSGGGSGRRAPYAVAQAGSHQGGLPASSPAGSPEIRALKSEARNLEALLQGINARLARLKGEGALRGLVAEVNGNLCTACGACEGVCPVGAITMDSVATADAARCTGCGACVTKCPRHAITMR